MPSELDRLAAELAREVRHAAGARADAQLVAAFHGMTSEVGAAVDEIEECAAVLRGPSSLVLPGDYPEQLRAHVDWILAQIEKVRAMVETDPMRVRQGSLWPDTRRAFTALRTQLTALLESSYADLTGSFAGDDRELLESVPPTIAGVREYRIAIEDFERRANTRPRTISDVEAAAECGNRLKSLRDKVEAEAVPAEFQSQWRLVRTVGLPLAELTDAFVAWLRERGLSDSTVLTYGKR